MNRFLFLLALLLPWFAKAANPAFTQFNTNDFTTNGYIVGVRWTNLPNVQFGGISNAGAPTIIDGTPGGVFGDIYYYSVTFYTTNGETGFGPAGVWDAQLGFATATVTNIPVGPAGVIGRKIYRHGSSGFYRLVTNINNNTSTGFTDNYPEAGLPVATRRVDTQLRNVIYDAGGNRIWQVDTNSQNIYRGLRAGISNGVSRGDAAIDSKHNLIDGDFAGEYGTNLTETVLLGTGVGRKIRSALGVTAVGPYAMEEAEGDQAYIFAGGQRAFWQLKYGRESVAVGEHSGLRVTNAVKSSYLADKAGGDLEHSSSNSVFTGQNSRNLLPKFHGFVGLSAESVGTDNNQTIVGGQDEWSMTRDTFFGNGVTNATPTFSRLAATSESGSNQAATNELLIAGARGTGTGAGGDVVIQTAPAGGSGSSLNAYASRVYVKSTGNVGIGTNAPANNLHVHGGIRAVLPAGDGTLIWQNASGDFVRTNTSSQSIILEYPGALIFNEGGAEVSRVSATGGGAVAAGPWAFTGGRVDIGTNVGVTTLEIFSSDPDGAFKITSPHGPSLLFVNTNGNVGLGTNAPTHTLHVNGHARIDKGVFLNRHATNASFTLTTNHYIYAWTAVAVAGTVTLPSAAGCQGFNFVLKDEGGNAGSTNITIALQADDRIDGATSRLLNANYGAINVYSAGGTNWFVF